MRRNLPALSDNTFDLLVVGAGIHGACVAWDACLRGLSVALVDRGDFGAATSANSLGIVHGGLRYLSRGDLPRMRESIRERSVLLRIAPTLVEPLPVLIGTYRRAARSRAALGTALLLNEIVSALRNRGLSPELQIPRGRLVSLATCQALFPWFPPDGLTGGALWHDARMRAPERLTLAFVRSAAERGAVVANYVRMDRLLVREGTAVGIAATDLDGGGRFDIKARSVVVAAGPWTTGLTRDTLEQRSRPEPGQALAVNVLISRPLSSVAVGVEAGNRFLFAVPRNDKTVLGTWYAVADSGPSATPEWGQEALVREFNQACPGLELSAADVVACQWGRLPLKRHRRQGAVELAERPRVTDHGSSGGVRHLLSVEGVKYTTARSVAQGVVDWVFRDLGKPAPRCETASTRLAQEPEPEGSAPFAGLGRDVIRRAVSQEMAVKLEDIVLRRSQIDTASLTRAELTTAARIAGEQLGWDPLRQEAEIESVIRRAGGMHYVEEPVG